jgi:hypothetical protein
MATERWERDRLKKILFDEDFGPKLVRLSKYDQRQVLDVLEQRGRTKPAEARKLIEKLDAERREHHRIIEKVRRHLKMTPVERSIHRPTDEGRAYWNAYDRATAGIAG